MIHRDLSDTVSKRSHKMEALLLWGPRQTGKTTILENLPDIKSVAYLDDLQLRSIANNDPKLFLDGFSFPLLIDECSYAPNLFPEIKLRIDSTRRELRKLKTSKIKTIFYLTSSNKMLLDKNTKESLAGRIQIYNLSGLTVSEILRYSKNIPLSQILFKGGLPELYARKSIDTIAYLNDYIISFIEKDLGLSSGVSRKKPFLEFLRILSGRTAHFLNYSELANSIGVTVPTIQTWCEMLELNQIIHLLPTYSTNLTKRVVKMKKLIFFDTGVCARLQGHSNEETLWTSPQAGFLFETLVINEVFKIKANFLKTWNLYTWRTKEKEEIDLIIEYKPEHFLLIEAKLSQNQTKGIRLGKEAKIAFGKSFEKFIVTPGNRTIPLSEETTQIPLQNLQKFLLEKIP